MKKILTGFNGFLVTILLIAIALSVSIMDVVINKKTIVNEVSRAGIYEIINNEMKGELKLYINNTYSNYPELIAVTDELVDSTIKVDVLKDETERLLDQIYNKKDKIELDLNKIIDQYITNLNEYLTAKNITLPDPVVNDMNRLIQKTSEQNADVSRYFKDIKPVVYLWKDAVVVAIAAIATVAAAFWIIAFICAKDKFGVFYWPLFVSGFFLIIIRIAGEKALEFLKTGLIEKANPNEYEWVNGLIKALQDTVIANITKFIVGFIIVGIILVVIKIVLKNRTNAKDRALEI